MYQSPGENSHLVYMALIVLLILTENENFAKDIHDMVSPFTYHIGLNLDFNPTGTA